MTELDLKISFYFRMYEDKVDGVLDHLRGLPGVRDLKVLRCVRIKDSKSKENLLKKIKDDEKGNVQKNTLSKKIEMIKKGGKRP